MPFVKLIFYSFSNSNSAVLSCCPSYCKRHTCQCLTLQCIYDDTMQTDIFWFLSRSIYQRLFALKLNGAWRYVEHGRIKLLASEWRSLGIPALLQHFMYFLKKKQQHRKVSAMQPICWLCNDLWCL